MDITVTANVKAVTRPEHGQPPLPTVKNIIAVGAGKGGVGKTTVSVNMALALSQMGAKVGILDGDVYGPNVPLMFGISAELGTDGEKIAPAEKFGVQIVSMAFLAKDDQALIWRGPMLHSAIRQFFTEVAWKDLDYLIIDMPPGTGDVALSLSQTVKVAGAVVVTTPQVVSLADTRRAVKMYEKLTIPTLGLVENMSYYACPNCHIESDIFGHGGGEQLATRDGRGVPGPAADLPADPRRRRSRRAARHRRTAVAGRARHLPACRARRDARGGGRARERDQAQGQDPAHSGASDAEQGTASGQRRAGSGERRRQGRCSSW